MRGSAARKGGMMRSGMSIWNRPLGTVGEKKMSKLSREKSRRHKAGRAKLRRRHEWNQEALALSRMHSRLVFNKPRPRYGVTR